MFQSVARVLILHREWPPSPDHVFCPEEIKGRVIKAHPKIYKTVPTSNDFKQDRQQKQCLDAACEVVSCVLYGSKGSEEKAWGEQSLGTGGLSF